MTLTGMFIFGVPVGDMNYCTHELGKLVTQFEETCDCDLAVKLAQQKWVYLLWVIRQKFTYWFRNMSPDITKQFIDRITGILKKKFTDLANFDVTDNYWQQICHEPPGPSYLHNGNSSQIKHFARRN